ncbi:hypothetical protein ALI144C_34280 [Actinosynnema sp. ALI-1.44]|uniref:helix-turn-helix transcriptional regulator n=1 Tax=Actinosynnema sp. ALI-1.44 TaxID=1933779 RepID=UPI00097C0D86|nr:helix-turn-helix transcriptional regulator [Actinosynnema sp. ALI-1.44]ONI77156.1 hypothetical protein ALI144C_34280 [Actinosynnema sp. ALI-1.44]
MTSTGLVETARAGDLDALGERVSDVVGRSIRHDGYYLQGLDPSGIESFGVGSLGPGAHRLRIPLVSGRRRYGLLTLWRHDEEFETTPVPFGRTFAPVLREYVTSAALARSARPLPPGVLVVGRDRVTAMSAEARAWLAAIPHWTKWERGALPRVAIRQLSKAARLALVDKRKPRAVTCVPAARCGQWVEIHGQVLADDLTLIIRPASGARLVSSLSWWYGITPRERQVLDLVCEGGSAKRIARVLELSTHTVNEYLQSIYRKTRSSGRDELVALLLQG